MTEKETWFIVLEEGKTGIGECGLSIDDRPDYEENGPVLIFI
jgi:hypothetical protein